MKLFMVLYIAGPIGGTIGPLPYGMVECQQRAADLLAEGNSDAVTLHGFTQRYVDFACEWHEDRPPNDPAAAELRP